ncbi:MAG TPA: DegT/DnrJ/EryC1/StrS family aminotransferase [Syntrophorhabdaceae bacterium]|nr:DegT/DnrJ/EryC1/StrS family aminotransferase [Syntrophorhabdaceae bacterium]
MADKISFLDLKRQYETIKDEVASALLDVCSRTAFSGGPFVEGFEKQFAEYCGARFGIAVNSGTSALHLAMIALGIGPGDEVIVPADTFIATAWAPSYVGATPVFVDCTADTWNIDPARIEKAITPRTRAIIGVHLYGQPFDIDAVQSIASERNLFLIEDAAQAHGARYKTKPVGTFGEVAGFSCYPGKNLGGYGEGGIITTNSSAYAEHIQRLRNHGSSVRYYHDELGFNMRMDGFQGAVLSVKLKYLDSWNARRKEIANKYFSGITNPAVKMQSQPAWSDSIYHLFVITAEDREAMIGHLERNGIFPGLHYPVPCHLQKAYAHLDYKKGDCPNAEYLADHCISLPMFAELTNGEVDRVIETVNAFRP